MSTNATSAAEAVNSLLGLSRNDHTAMLDVLHNYFTTRHEDSEQESDDCDVTDGMEDERPDVQGKLLLKTSYF